MTTGIAPFRRRDFEVSVEVDQLDPAQASEFADAICRAKPSRLDNLLEIEVMHRPDGCTHQTVQAIVDRDVRMLSEDEIPGARPDPSRPACLHGVRLRAGECRRSVNGDESTEPGRR